MLIFNVCDKTMKEKKVIEAASFLSELIPRIIKGAQIDFLAGQKITHLQFLTMVALSCFKDCKMSQLARNMKMSYPQATGIVNRLIILGFLKRDDLSTDRRVVLITLAPKGKQLITRFKEMLKLRWQQIMVNLEEKEIDILLKSLKTIAEKVQEE
jgi:MarR family transcriptional regulator, organic hydroperoxide resistance regulator